MSLDPDDDTALSDPWPFDNPFDVRRSNISGLNSKVPPIEAKLCLDSDGDCAGTNSWCLPLICIVSITLGIIVIAQLIYCLIRARRRKQLAVLENPPPLQRSVSTVSASLPPPRYSEIFDQHDGASIFEEPPPDYETMKPDLVKTISRASSVVSTRKWICQPETVVIDETVSTSSGEEKFVEIGNSSSQFLAGNNLENRKTDEIIDRQNLKEEDGVSDEESKIAVLRRENDATDQSIKISNRELEMDRIAGEKPDGIIYV